MCILKGGSDGSESSAFLGGADTNFGGMSVVPVQYQPLSDRRLRASATFKLAALALAMAVCF